MQSPQAPESVAATAPPTPQVSSPVGWLDRWPVKLRLFVTTLVALAAITAVTVTTVAVTARERAAFTRLVMLERVQRTLREARADIDAIRADVLMLVFDSGQGAPSENVRLKPDATTVKPGATSMRPGATTLKADATTVNPGATTVRPDVTNGELRQRVEASRRVAIGVMAASIPDEIRKAITDVQPSMSAYLDAAANLERLAQTNHAAAANALPAFHASFAALSAAREQLAGRVTAMAAEAEKNAVETARTDLAIVAVAWLLAFIVVTAAGRITATSIAHALTRVKAAAHAIAEGDLSIRSDTPVDDDVGAVAGAVNRMADTLQTMIARLQAEQEQDAFSRQLSEILDMADTESDTYAVVARAMSAVSTDMPMELLVADSSRAHLERATVHPVAGASCCTVESPYGCMAVRRGNPIVFDSSETLNACARLRDRKTGPVSAVCVPLSFMGRSLGVLHATGAVGRPPEQRVVSQLNTVGILAGSRIGTVRAFERTQVQASTDVLTGLLNRRSLESRVRRFDPAQDYAVVVADIDHFKRLNDTHGHEAGDRALRVFADVLRRSVREGDYTARWGGEEFMIVLEGRDARAALEVVDRIRENLRAACQIKGTPEITSSYGVSDTSMDRTFEQLVRVADDALYQSKESGRNRVTIGDPLRVAGAVPRRDAEHLASIEVGELSPAQ